MLMCNNGVLLNHDMKNAVQSNINEALFFFFNAIISDKQLQNYVWSVQFKIELIKTTIQDLTRLAPAESWRQLSFVCYGNAESVRALSTELLSAVYVRVPPSQLSCCSAVLAADVSVLNATHSALSLSAKARIIPIS